MEGSGILPRPNPESWGKIYNKDLFFQESKILRLATKLEAILYLKGRALTVDEMAIAANCDLAMVEEGLLELMTDYAHRDSALEVVETNEGYCLQLRSSYQNLIDELVPAELGVGTLRTLAVIALKHPLVQTDLIELRGSSAYQHVQELVELGLVRKRKQTEGRSFWLEITDKFHQYFETDQESLALLSLSPGAEETEEMEVSLERF